MNSFNIFGFVMFSILVQKSKLVLKNFNDALYNNIMTKIEIKNRNFRKF